MNLNATDRITILYNFILVVFIFIFRAKIAAYAYHLAFNLSVILIVLLLSSRRRSSLSVCTVSLWYPLVLYGLLYYQTGLINRVFVPQFLDGFFMNLDVWIFGEFPAFFLRGKHGNAFFDEFFHFFYFSYYLIIPLTGILLFRKEVRLFQSFVFQLSSLFYLCFFIFILLPVEGPIALRNEYYHQGGLFQTMVDFIYRGGENPGAAFPSSHVAATFLVTWWGSTHFKRMRIPYWLTFLFLSIATVYCMFHYAVDVIGGLFLGVLAVLTFNRVDIKRYYEETHRGTCKG
ncbi:MAG: phosphatase PAP2 family protein [Desulfobacteraceae bacterium]|nr:phosphatase PAP2 family protein [Desulfobacteraceae bacterium]